MRSSVRLLVALPLLSGVLTWAAGAAAQAAAPEPTGAAAEDPAEIERVRREMARPSAAAGRKAFDTGDYRGALELFLGAEHLVHAPPHLLYIARCYEKLGMPADARAAYLRLLGERLPANAPRAFGNAQKSGEPELVRLEPRVPHMVVEIEGAPPEQVELSIDGAKVEAKAARYTKHVNPGPHEVKGRLERGQETVQKVDVPEGPSTTTVRISLTADAASSTAEVSTPEDETADYQAVPGWIVLGLGSAGATAAVVTFGLAEGQADAHTDAQQGVGSDLGTASLVLVVVGGTLTLAGAAWLIGVAAAGKHQAEPESPEAASVAAVWPVLGPGWLGLSGRF
jgi:hypothetical protein